MAFMKVTSDSVSNDGVRSIPVLFLEAPHLNLEKVEGPALV